MEDSRQTRVGALSIMSMGTDSDSAVLTGIELAADAEASRLTEALRSITGQAPAVEVSAAAPPAAAPPAWPAAAASEVSLSP